MQPLRWFVGLCLALSSFMVPEAKAEPVATPRIEQLAVPGGQFNVHWQDRFSPKEQRRLRLWLSDAAESASLLSGSFPGRQTNIFLHRSTSGKGPVPWAHTVRAEAPEGVVFHVQPRKKLRQFIADWTATHEFSHLYLPYVGRDDIWLAEGFASYYQYILMMRRGTLSEAVGWQKFVDGLSRGENDPYQQGPLHLASRLMREKRAYKRVYWSGALYFLAVDLDLRAQGSSLDQVIEKFQSCCRHQAGPWSGKRLVAQLDQAGATRVFSEKFRRFENITGFPDYQPLLRRLGITWQGKRIQLSEATNAAKLRRSISQPQSTGRVR